MVKAGQLQKMRRYEHDCTGGVAARGGAGAVDCGEKSRHRDRGSLRHGYAWSRLTSPNNSRATTAIIQGGGGWHTWAHAALRVRCVPDGAAMRQLVHLHRLKLLQMHRLACIMSVMVGAVGFPRGVARKHLARRLICG